MNIKKLFFTTIWVSILAFSLTLSGASVHAPGSAEDPLVTRSYVDRLIADLTGITGGPGELSPQQLELIVTMVMNRLAQQEQGAHGGFQHDTGGRYTPVSMREGQVLAGDEGTEIILRTGTAVVNASGQDGLANVTTGEDVRHNQEIGANNMLIVPRDDGRGIRATSDVWLLVKGRFSIF